MLGERVAERRVILRSAVSSLRAVPVFAAALAVVVVVPRASDARRTRRARRQSQSAVRRRRAEFARVAVLARPETH